jgi:hypothetical protein
MDMACWANETPPQEEVDFIFQSGMQIIPLDVEIQR